MAFLYKCHVKLSMEELAASKPSWAQLEGEPDDMYEVFVQFYLALGIGRTLAQAYALYYEKFRSPESTAQYLKPPQAWFDAARKWEWRLRSLEYDKHQLQIAANTIQAARQKIQQSTVLAVDALIEALDNPRLKVAAAKEILDRGGVPTKTVHVLEMQPYTADDFAQAAKEVELWERKMLDKSG